MLSREQLSVLRSIRPGLLYEFLQEVAKLRSEKRMRRAMPNVSIHNVPENLLQSIGVSFLDFTVCIYIFIQMYLSTRCFYITRDQCERGGRAIKFD